METHPEAEVCSSNTDGVLAWRRKSIHHCGHPASVRLASSSVKGFYQRQVAHTYLHSFD